MYFHLIWILSNYGCIRKTYELIFSLKCFSFVKASRISERSCRKKINFNLRDRPKNLNFIFILLIRSRVCLNLNAVSLKLKKKKKSTHTKNECFSVKYLKLMAKSFNKAFFLSSNSYSLYWILQLVINPIHESDIYL